MNGATEASARLLPERVPRYRRTALRESELARLWESQRLPPESLVTGDGREVRVQYRGRRGTGPGPDFRDAVLVIDGVACRGDVELHVRSSDFQRHGHQHDRAYLRLMLHVVYRDDGAGTELLDGRSVPTVTLERWVRRRAGELRALLADADEYREPCHTAVARLGTERPLEVLIAMGEERLRAKARALTALLDEAGADEALYLAVARALGLTRNVAPMEAVARAVPLADVRAIAASHGNPRVALEGALLGAAGLLDGQLALWPVERDGREAALLHAWHSAGAPAAAGAIWVAGPVRPGSGPRERLAGLAALCTQSGAPFDCTLAGWRDTLAAGPAALIASLSVPKFIGTDRAIELAVNAVLPWLLAAYGAEQIGEAVFACFRRLPAPQTYGISRVIAGALRDERDRSLLRSAASVQGAVQMTRDWCTQGGCGRCPLS